jgi:flagellar biosynthesis protein FliP
MTGNGSRTSGLHHPKCIILCTQDAEPSEGKRRRTQPRFAQKSLRQSYAFFGEQTTRWDRLRCGKRQMLCVALAAVVFGLAAVTPAYAQPPNLQSLIPPTDGSTTGRIMQMLAVMTVLSVAPALLIMVTCFTRFVLAFSFLRAGLGLQTTPANLILISLALFMTFYVMAPTFDHAWQNGVKPLIENKINEEEAYTRITTPFKVFMRLHVRDKDLRLFADLAEAKFATAPRTPAPPSASNTQATDKDTEPELRVLIPAFMISELRRGFEIGFLITLPFLVIDMIVATLTMSMGMMMLPPTILSLPFKILFFILIDGWNMLVGGLIRSFT